MFFLHDLLLFLILLQLLALDLPLQVSTLTLPFIYKTFRLKEQGIDSREFFFSLCVGKSPLVISSPLHLSSGSGFAALPFLWAAMWTVPCLFFLALDPRSLHPGLGPPVATKSRAVGTGPPACQLLRGTVCVKKQKTIKPTRSQTAFIFTLHGKLNNVKSSVGLSFKQWLWLLVSFNYTHIRFTLAHFYYLFLNRHCILHER